MHSRSIWTFTEILKITQNVKISKWVYPILSLHSKLHSDWLWFSFEQENWPLSIGKIFEQTSGHIGSEPKLFHSAPVFDFWHIRIPTASVLKSFLQLFQVYKNILFFYKKWAMQAFKLNEETCPESTSWIKKIFIRTRHFELSSYQFITDRLASRRVSWPLKTISIRITGDKFRADQPWVLRAWKLTHRIFAATSGTLIFLIREIKLLTNAWNRLKAEIRISLIIISLIISLINYYLMSKRQKFISKNSSQASELKRSYDCKMVVVMSIDHFHRRSMSSFQ